jgi:ATP-binding cassette subfamily B protein
MLLKKVQQLKKSLLKLKQAIQFVLQAAPGWATAQVCLVFIQGILPLGLLYLTKLIVDTIAASLTLTDKSEVLAQVNILLILAVAVMLLTIVCNALADLVNTALSDRVTDYMLGMLYAKSIEIDLEYYETSQYQDTLQRAQKEAPFRPRQILSHLTQVAESTVSLIAMVGLLLSLHWGVAGVLFVGAIPAMLVRVKYTGLMYHWERQRTSMERQAWYRGVLITGEYSAKEIRLFNLGHHFLKQFKEIRHKIFREKLAIKIKNSTANLLAQSVAGIFIFAVYGFIIYQTIEGDLQLGDLVLYHQALQRGQNALKTIVANLGSLYEDNLFLTNLFEFLELKPKVVETASPKPIPPKIKTGIAFNNVSFQYADTNRQALKDINLTIKPGETIALVGENGSGKTTLIKLLCRLYDPTSGNITLDGIDLRHFSIADLRHQIGVIFQDYAKYHLSARDNIWFGNINLAPNDSKITQAACYSGADAVIQTLPQGYNTILGKWFERGEELSIGQWQKIALARAFTRDSQIIVLDEPTSAMDPKAEYEVFQQFRHLIGERAGILISHRLSTVKMADCIYVMDKGAIAESGTHEELMELRGVYAHLFETQAKSYR